MSITTASSTNASSLSQLLAAMAASKVSSTSSISGTTATTSITSTSDTVDISKPAELYSKLQQSDQLSCSKCPARWRHTGEEATSLSSSNSPLFWNADNSLPNENHTSV